MAGRARRPQERSVIVYGTSSSRPEQFIQRFKNVSIDQNYILSVQIGSRQLDRRNIRNPRALVFLVTPEDRDLESQSDFFGNLLEQSRSFLADNPDVEIYLVPYQAKHLPSYDRDQFLENIHKLRGNLVIMRYPNTNEISVIEDLDEAQSIILAQTIPEMFGTSQPVVDVPSRAAIATPSGPFVTAPPRVAPPPKPAAPEETLSDEEIDKLKRDRNIILLAGGSTSLIVGLACGLVLGLFVSAGTAFSIVFGVSTFGVGFLFTALIAYLVYKVDEAALKAKEGISEKTVLTAGSVQSAVKFGKSPGWFINALRRGETLDKIKIPRELWEIDDLSVEYFNALAESWVLSPYNGPSGIKYTVAGSSVTRHGSFPGQERAIPPRFRRIVERIANIGRVQLFTSDGFIHPEVVERLGLNVEELSRESLQTVKEKLLTTFCGIFLKQLFEYANEQANGVPKGDIAKAARAYYGNYPHILTEKERLDEHRSNIGFIKNIISGQEKGNYRKRRSQNAGTFAESIKASGGVLSEATPLFISQMGEVIKEQAYGNRPFTPTLEADTAMNFAKVTEIITRNFLTQDASASNQLDVWGLREIGERYRRLQHDLSTSYESDIHRHFVPLESLVSDISDLGRRLFFNLDGSIRQDVLEKFYEADPRILNWEVGFTREAILSQFCKGVLNGIWGYERTTKYENPQWEWYLPSDHSLRHMQSAQTRCINWVKEMILRQPKPKEFERYEHQTVRQMMQDKGWSEAAPVEAELTIEEVEESARELESTVRRVTQSVDSIHQMLKEAVDAQATPTQHEPPEQKELTLEEVEQSSEELESQAKKLQQSVDSFLEMLKGELKETERKEEKGTVEEKHKPGKEGGKTSGSVP